MNTLLRLYKLQLLLSTLSLLAISQQMTGQCSADFTFSGSGIFYQFADMSTTTEGDSIINYSWNFGDGSVATVANPDHIFTFPDTYEITLAIATEAGCTDTTRQTITNCSLTLNASLGTNCNDGVVDLALNVVDNFNLIDQVDILLDGVPLQQGGYAIDGNLNLNIDVPGDDAIHSITLQSDYSPECFEEFFFVSEDCSVTCIFSDIAVDVNENHTIEIRDTTFFPANRIITIGDTVNFDWVAPANSTTSDTTAGPDAWDSGVQFVGSSFQVIPQTLGVKPYYSIPRGGPGGEGMSGTIIVNCPPTGTKEIAITIQNNPTSQGGFRVAIDDVFLQDEEYSYDASGTTELTIPYPFDGRPHKVSVQDNTNSKCNLSQVVTAADCGGEMPCHVNVNAYQLDRCDKDGNVRFVVDVNAIGPSASGISVLLDGAFTIDMLTLDSTGFATGTYTIPGDGAQHSITVRDVGEFDCSAVTNFTVTECDANCNFSQIGVVTGTQPILELILNNTGISQGPISVPADQGLLFRWATDRVYGIRASLPDSSAVLWDSGLKTNGEIYLTPAISSSIRYEVYDQNEQIITGNNFDIVRPCEDGFIPVFISFTDVNGSKEGYNITIDGNEITTSEYFYLNGNRNYAAFQIIGDDTTHTITIKDKQTAGCEIDTEFFAAACSEFQCLLDFSIADPDTCFNDDRVLLELTIGNTNPLPRGYRVSRNGVDVYGEALAYQSDSLSTVQDTVLADGSTYVYIVTDELNENCSDTFTITPEPCLTNCTLSGLQLQLIDDAYLAANPSTPELFVGCQSDTTHFIAVSFFERYSDATEYGIYIDEVLYSTPDYASGDGLNTIFIPVFADSTGHLIRVTDLLAGSCTLQDTIHMPKCFTECVYDVLGTEFNACHPDSTELSIYLNRPAAGAIAVTTAEGTAISFLEREDTLIIPLNPDGQARTYVLTEIENPLCTDTVQVIAPYCLNCDIVYNLTQQDSCVNGDTVSYTIEIDSPSEEEIGITIGSTSDTISTSLAYDFVLIGSGGSTTITLYSLTDEFCSVDTLVMTEDCSPVICEADFSIMAEGLTYTFTDESTTSEPITSQSWQIEGGITVMNTATFTFVFDSVGVYTICHTIETDSCLSEVCKMVAIDPCEQLSAFFEVAQSGDTYTFTSVIAGSVDSLVYTFGDGSSTSNLPNPQHTYSSTGSYEVCLEVFDNIANCSSIYCEQLDFISSASDPVGNETVTVYPNPAGVGSKLHIKSTAAISGYALYGSDGKLIQSADTFGPVDKLSFIIQEMPQGQIGIVHVKTAKGTFTRRIVIN